MLILNCSFSIDVNLKLSIHQLFKTYYNVELSSCVDSIIALEESLFKEYTNLEGYNINNYAIANLVSKCSKHGCYVHSSFSFNILDTEYFGYSLYKYYTPHN